ncbi:MULTISPECIES: SAM-dependent methyltransferase [unclassified Streptomyces]|uniref:SAM-dependent methyltransferase n=1 Tax=unclassified Streptomyces TaxID=2593676 RepID=UPI00081EB018|nr:class I SAM-dependent methyltransferase [Streptomyces sp. ScaeMP-e83]SCD34086.1 Cyclopropane fatty-acyl-phospholipid synthase [Streptomyces sp. ScaeMP-e83]
MDIHEVAAERPNPYRRKVESTYEDPPWMWEAALGPGNLLFQFGLFGASELAAGPGPGSVGPSEVRHFEKQLEIAGLGKGREHDVRRVLDLGSGWGFLTGYLAERFPGARRVDSVNVSRRQLEYASAQLAGSPAADRIRLYLCDGQDIGLLPEPEALYDLVVVRGVYTHFPDEVFEASVAAVAARMRPGGLLVISDTLYKTDISRYRSPVTDTVDRLACGHRKSPAYFLSVLERSGMMLEDMRVLPGNREVIHWFGKVRANIDTRFPEGVRGPIAELREMCDSFSATLASDQASVCSVITRRAPGPGGLPPLRDRHG